jgi:hypothetical protein
LTAWKTEEEEEEEEENEKNEVERLNGRKMSMKRKEEEAEEEVEDLVIDTKVKEEIERGKKTIAIDISMMRILIYLGEERVILILQ